MQQFGESVFCTVKRGSKISEMQNNCTLHKLMYCVICVPKIIKVSENLKKFWQKTLLRVFGKRCISPASMSTKG